MSNRITNAELTTESPAFAKPLLPAVVGLKRYSTIVIDPPWEVKNNLKDVRYYRSGSQRMPYEQMTDRDIMKLPIENLADENCELYLWTTQKYLPDAFEVLKAWGFKYCQTLTWCKTPMGTGQGGVFCPTTEFLILGRKGKMPKVKRIDTTWWNVKRTNKHSKKPEFFQDLIETVSDAPRLEMFARRERENWDVWGNELENDVELETSANNGT
jgi:N6-adenosine-specific RNA methylase IME4